MYTLVQFVETEEIEVVPDKWIVGGDHVMWPPLPDKEASRAVRRGDAVDPDTWVGYDVILLSRPGNLTSVY